MQKKTNQTFWLFACPKEKSTGLLTMGLFDLNAVHCFRQYCKFSEPWLEKVETVRHFIDACQCALQTLQISIANSKKLTFTFSDMLIYIWLYMWTLINSFFIIPVLATPLKRCGSCITVSCWTSTVRSAARKWIYSMTWRLDWETSRPTGGAHIHWCSFLGVTWNCLHPKTEWISDF